MMAMSALIFSSNVLAKTTSLYEQPQTNSKVVGTIDLSTGVTPIFTPKGGEWVKVGDPHNGNVGWIKASDLAGGNTSSFSFTQKVISNGKEPQTYKIEFGNMPAITTKQAEEVIKNMQLQQNNFQQSAQKIIQDMITNINRVYSQQPKLLQENGSVIMPIVIIPASALKVPEPVVPAKK
jgi:hypothetical protein